MNGQRARQEFIVALGVSVVVLLATATFVGGPTATGEPRAGYNRAAPFTQDASPTTYPVTFTESALPPGTNWSVSLNEITHSSTSTRITFEEPNGTYSLYTWDVKGYLSYANRTALNVTGAPVDITVYYDPPTAGTYFVTFVQSGLQFNVFWKIQVSAIINGTVEGGGIGQNYFGPTHTAAGGVDGLENGSFEWTAFPPSTPEWPIPDYFPFPSTGIAVIHGSSVLINLTYRFAYPFFFNVAGLAAGASFTLQIPNETVTGSGSGEYLLMIPNGTWAWVATAAGYQSQNGSVTVNGFPESNVVSFTFVALPASPSWLWIEVALTVVAILIVAIVILLVRRRRETRMLKRNFEAQASTSEPAKPPQPPR